MIRYDKATYWNPCTSVLLFSTYKVEHFGNIVWDNILWCVFFSIFSVKMRIKTDSKQFELKDDAEEETKNEETEDKLQVENQDVDMVCFLCNPLTCQSFKAKSHLAQKLQVILYKYVHCYPIILCWITFRRGIWHSINCTSTHWSGQGNLTLQQTAL